MQAPRAAPTLRLQEWTTDEADFPDVLARSLVLVVTGALGNERLEEALVVTSTLTRALAPVAAPSEVSAWSATWEFDEDVDADSILPALGAVVPVLSVPEPLRLAFGVLTPWGEYLPLAFRQRDVAGARDEADVNAAAVRTQYKLDTRPNFEDELDALEFFTLEAE